MIKEPGEPDGGNYICTNTKCGFTQPITFENEEIPSTSTDLTDLANKGKPIDEED